jgi:2-polyprenyl-6-methoxyphenol hydroxylase-like FAD-dependent oxidoreductase
MHNRFRSFGQTDDLVASQIRDLRTGHLVNIESSYLIGADGARSAVRDAIGATMVGDGAFSRNYSVIFRAPDLATRQVHEPAFHGDEESRRCRSREIRSS